MSERFELPEINDKRFEEEAKQRDKKRPILKRLLGKDKTNPVDVTHQEALVQDEWRDIEAEESRSPLNEIAHKTGTGLYRPFILDTPEEVEAYADRDPRRSFGFAAGYGVARMFGAVPGAKMIPRILGGMKEGKMAKESFNDFISRLIQKKIDDRKDASKPLRVLELGAGRTYGEDAYFSDLPQNYGTPWLSRFLKITYGDAVDVSICDIVSDWVKTPRSIPLEQKAEDKGPIVFCAEKGTLDVCHDAQNYVPLGATGPESIAPTKTFSPVIAEGDRKLFARPRLDPVFEKMVFGVNAYGNVNMRDNKNIRALLGTTTGDFDLVFARNVYVWPSPDEIEPLLSDSGTYINGGFWYEEDYYPVIDLAEKNGKREKMNVLRNTPEEILEKGGFDDHFRNQGLIGPDESLANPLDHEKQRANARRAIEFIATVREGFSRGVAEAKKQFAL